METTTLGNLISLQRGYDLTETQRRPGKVPIVGSAGVHGYHDTARAKGPGVALGRSGASFGKVSYVNEDYWPHNTTIFVTDFKGNEPLFIRYLLESLDFSSLNSGSAQQSLNRNYVYLVPVKRFALPIQRRIAGLLSAYDDLIENSQRRIKILESMARALYREWFVHFRFPGHENHPRVASPLGEIPEGWEVKPFSALATYVNGYPFKPAQLGADGMPVIKIKELKGGIVADTPRNSGQEIPGKYHVEDGDVLFSWSADLDVYLWTGGAGLLNQHLFTVLPENNVSLAFCFHSLKEAMPRFRALSLGATMHHIKRSALDQVATVVAPEVVRQSFDALVVPLHRQVLTLTKHVANLRRTRDLLLPRLLSGQIALDELEAA